MVFEPADQLLDHLDSLWLISLGNNPNSLHGL
jgi:hypothetical protein